MTDLLARTAELVGVPSLSHEEGPLADLVEQRLRALGHLVVERVGENVVARTELGRGQRLVLAGHLDTVPPDGNAVPRIEGDVLWGVGAADMKGGLAVMLELAEAVREPAVDVTWCFTSPRRWRPCTTGCATCRAPPELVQVTPLLGEPGAALEAGCQGDAPAGGRGSPPARGWGATPSTGRVTPPPCGPRAPATGHRQLRVPRGAGGGRGRRGRRQSCPIVRRHLNHRSPDRTTDEARAAVEAVLAPHLEPDDEVELVDVADAAPPALSHPLLAALRARNDLPVRAKLGWTDVSRFAAAGIPAANFGPGDSTLAHRADERVERASLDAVYRALEDLLRHGT